MTRLVIEGESFQKLSSKALYESEYQRLLLSNAESLFPDFHLASFSPLIQSEYDTRRPDLALVDKELRAWWVIEVELADHSMAGHVLPQVEGLARGRYGTDEAARLSAAIPALRMKEALDLLKGEQPKILVIVNEERENWEDELRRVPASLMVVEVFRSDRNKHALRVNGHYPELPEDILTVCRRDSRLPGFLIVESPAKLPSAGVASLFIDVEGALTEWSRIDVQDRVWLRPHGVNPLEGLSGPFNLAHTADGRLVLD